MKKRNKENSPAPNTLNAATPQRSSRSFSDNTTLSSSRPGSCSLRDSAIFSSPSPHARHNFCTTLLLAPQSGQNITTHSFRQRNGYDSVNPTNSNTSPPNAGNKFFTLR